jgi:hypothetical protein
MIMKKANKRSKTHDNRKPGQLIYINTMYWDIPSYNDHRYVIVATDVKFNRNITLFAKKKKIEIKYLLTRWLKQHNKYIKYLIINGNTSPAVRREIRTDKGNELINNRLL